MLKEGPHRHWPEVADHHADLGHTGKGGPVKRGSSMRMVDLDESSDTSYGQQLREALSQQVAEYDPCTHAAITRGTRVAVRRKHMILGT